MAGTGGVAGSERPGERRAAARTTVVWNALHAVLAGEPEAQVLDIGGGTGGFAVRVAELGHRVRVVDPSPDALAALGRRAEEQGLAGRVTAQQGDLSTLLEIVPEASVDVVLCHGVLEVIDDPAAALATIAAVLRPGGTLSLLVAQRHAAVLARAMAGHFGQARALLDGGPGDVPARGRGTGRRWTAAEIASLVDAAGFTVTSQHAVRVFSDLVPGAVLDAEVGAADALIELELAVAELPEYLPLATQIHVLATR
jgi:S-adenosylmethionine-dependent methyltransferase